MTPLRRTIKKGRAIIDGTSVPFSIRNPITPPGRKLKSGVARFSRREPHRKKKMALRRGFSREIMCQSNPGHPRDRRRYLVTFSRNHYTNEDFFLWASNAGPCAFFILLFLDEEFGHFLHKPLRVGG